MGLPRPQRLLLRLFGRPKLIVEGLGFGDWVLEMLIV